MNKPALLLPSFAALVLAGCTGETSSGAESAEAIPASAPDEAVDTAGQYKLTAIAEGFDQPWGILGMPDDDQSFLISERDGRINRVGLDGTVTPISGGPEAFVANQGGYFGLVADPDFANNRTIYLSYAKGDDDANATAIFKAELSEDGTALLNGEDIYQADLRDTAYHFGGRLQFLPDGTLVAGLGDGFRYMQDAQSTDNTHGTLIRINSDGSIPADNPLVGVEGAAEEVYSWGHRNIQGLLFDSETGALFAHEHGPKGGDELNVIEAGKNYGWPTITYGVNYDGTVITELTAAEGLEQPATKWVPSIAPSGMMRYTGDKYPDWTGDLLIGAMNGPAGQKLVSLDMDGTSVVSETHYLTDVALPIRDLVQGPDGFVYVITQEYGGGLFRVDPA
ncbi:MAG: PQQ-dependent sugar dehydrogenase [Pseudomonadota bacterium]